MKDYLTEEDYETARKNGIHYNLAYNRVYVYGWEPERAITEPPFEMNKPTGEWDDWKEVCEQNGVSHQLFRTRKSRALKKGMTDEQAAFYAAYEPVKKARGLAAKQKSINEHMAAYGFTEVQQIYAATY